MPPLYMTYYIYRPADITGSCIRKSVHHKVRASNRLAATGSSLRSDMRRKAGSRSGLRLAKSGTFMYHSRVRAELTKHSSAATQKDRRKHAMTDVWFASRHREAECTTAYSPTVCIHKSYFWGINTVNRPTAEVTYAEYATFLLGDYVICDLYQEIRGCAFNDYSRITVICSSNCNLCIGGTEIGNHECVAYLERCK